MTLAIIVVCAATILAVPTGLARSNLPRPAVTSHSPILIQGDSEFKPANGVTGGSGTASDPYLLVGWDVDSSSTVGIEIRNTTAFAVIRSIHISSNPIWSGNGVFLTNVRHVRVENSTIEYNSLAFQAISSSDVKIANCTLHFNDETVNLGWTDHAWVEANTIDSNGAEVGVSAQTSQDIVVGNNSFTREAWSVSMVSVTDTLVLGNFVEQSTVSSIIVSDSSTIQIENNTLVYVAGGISLDSIRDAVIAGNLLVDSPIALSVTHSPSLLIQGNNFSRAGIGMQFDTVSSSTVTDNLVDTYGDTAVTSVDGRNLTLTRNSLRGGGLVLKGAVLADFDSHTISADNLVNGLPLRYFRDCSGVAIDGVATGQVIVANCTGVTIANLSLSGASIGADVHTSNHVMIFNTTFAGNRIAGVSVSSVSDISVQGNNITGNMAGLRVSDSYSGHVWHNAFLQNAQSASLTAVSEFDWDGGYPIGGNYWSDYGGPDDCWGFLQNICSHGDGLGDFPYLIDGMNSDHYPLMGVNLSIPPHGPPILTANITGTQGTNGWLKSPATLTLTATDTGGGVEVITYSVDGGSWQNYSAPLTFFDGAYLVSYTATDLVGNTADVNAVVIRVDSASPQIRTHVGGTPGADGWFTSLVSVSVHAFDNGSGVQRLGYRLDDGAAQDYSGPILLSEGVRFINVTATDVAGNTAVDSIEVRVDLTPPVLELKALAAIVTTRVVTVSWTGTDRTSGISVYEVSVDGGARRGVGLNTSFTASLPEGPHTITVWAVDAAGNSVSETVTFQIDTNIFSPSGPYAGMPTYGLIATAAVVAVFFLLRRRKRVSPPPASPPRGGHA